MKDADLMQWSVPELMPLTATRVARRSLVLSAVVCRASIESGVTNSDAQSLHGRIIDWLTCLNLWDEVEPDEAAMLRSPLGLLVPSDVIQAAWYVEGLAILAWALKYLKFPVYGEQVDAYTITDALWFLDESAVDIITSAELRSLAELEACREFFYATHSRLRDHVRNALPRDFTRWVEKEWLNLLGIDADSLFVQSDLAIDGKSISETDDERLQEVMAITLEQHRAIIWLVEGYVNYSETPVDT